MKIFITGATGFLGIRLCQMVADQGHIVHALYRSATKAKSLCHDKIILFKGDVNDVESLRRAMENCDAVFHLAAYAKVWAKDPLTFKKINIEGTRNVLSLAKELGVKKTVFVSTAGVFGPSTDRIINEKAKRSKLPCTEYEQTKKEAEQLVMNCVNGGQHIVIVNPTRVFGPGPLNDSNSVTRMISLYVKGKFRVLPGDGNSIGNYVYIDDTVNGLILAMNKGRNGEKYIIGGINVSYRDFFKILSYVSGRKFVQYNLPVSIMLAVSSVMLITSKIFGVPPLITPRWVRKYNYNWEITSKKSIEELGYRITPLEDGLHKTLQYLKELKLSYQ